MKLYYTLCFFLWLLGLMVLSATQVQPLENLINPQSIRVKKPYIYITHPSKVSIYSLKEGKFIKTFGTAGSGPREFKPLSSDAGLELSLLPKQIMVASFGKISTYTLKGDFIKEVKVLRGHGLKPLGNHFAECDLLFHNKLQHLGIMIYNQRFEPIGTPQKKLFWYNRNHKINPIDVKGIPFETWGKRLFVDNQQGQINIYDDGGKKLHQTKPIKERAEVSPSDQKHYLEYYSQHKLYRKFYHRFKHLVRFPRYFPHIKYFGLSKNRIYVLTFLVKEESNQLFVYDFEGNLIKSTYIQIPPIDHREIFPLITISHHHLYQIQYDQDQEQWFLNQTPLDQIP